METQGNTNEAKQTQEDMVGEERMAFPAVQGWGGGGRLGQGLAGSHNL